MNIDDIKNRLLIKYPLFGSVIANSSFIEEKRIDTAGTDGKNIYYNPKFLGEITEEKQLFILAHEVCHIAFNHVYRGKDKDKKIWNIATDSVINALLENEGLHMVEGGVNIPEAINYDAEEMYNKLLEEKKKQEEASNEDNSSNKQNSNENNSNSNQNNSRDNEQNNNQKEQNSSDGENSNNENNPFERDNNDVGHDTHSLWDKTLEQSEQENSETKDNEENNSSSEQKQSENNNENDSNEKGEDNNEENSKDNNQKEKESSDGKKSDNKLNKKVEELIEKMTHLGERKTFKQNKIERKKYLQELRDILAKQSQGYGTNTNSNSRKINDIGISEQLIDWRLVLKEAIHYNIDWSFENATIEDGVVTPHLEEHPFCETEIVLDTSGSIDSNLLKNFLRECKNIIQASKVKIGCFDTKFYGFVEIKDITDIDNLEFYGGGGTDFNVAVNAFTRRVENKIIFTDGDAEMPEKPLDVIWIVFGNRKIYPPGGKVIYIDDIELKRLSKDNYIKKVV